MLNQNAYDTGYSPFWFDTLLYPYPLEKSLDQVRHVMGTLEVIMI